VRSLPEKAFVKAVVLFVVDHSAAAVSECANAAAVGRLSDCHLSAVYGPVAGTHIASGLEAVGGVMLLRMLLAAQCDIACACCVSKDCKALLILEHPVIIHMKSYNIMRCHFH